MTPERALLRRLEQRVFAYDAGNRGGGNYFDDLREIAEAARALLAEPEGEKSSGCPRRQSPQTPCVLEVGPMDADEEGICVGCGMPWEGAVRQQERPTPRSRAEGSDLSVDQGREFRVVDGLGDSNRAGKVTIDPTLLSPPTPRSRAEAEAMVERFASALGLHVDHWLGPTETQRTEIADARAALLAALTGDAAHKGEG